MNNLNEIPSKPRDVQWTDAQWQAIHASGSDMLVAAAAGSGKTAVLVRRIIEKVTSKENPIDVDKMLVLTFTNAAAAEMRSRLHAALEKEVEENPESKNLRKQLNLVNKAQISTLHSFCIEVLRSNFHKLDLDPGFKIANETEVELLLEEAIVKVLERRFAESRTEFYKLVETFSSDRSDSEMNKLIVKIYKFSLSHPNPNEWLDGLRNAYQAVDSIESLAIFPYIKQEVELSIDSAIQSVEYGRAYCLQPGGSVAIDETLASDLDGLKLAKEKISRLSNNNWLEIPDSKAIFKRQKPEKEKSEAIDSAKELRAKAKKDYEKIYEKYFSRDITLLLEEMVEMHQVVSELTDVVKEVHIAFSEEKNVKNMLDFNDLEHLTLRLFGPDENEKDSEVANNYRKKFAEIYVDEYQDTNGVQEKILSFIKEPNEGTGNMFMVGDVKQSIYKFRLADPSLFVSKYNRFTKEPTENGLLIDLNQNFRSRKEVLSGTNFIFEQIMSEYVGEINYDRAASLHFGARNYPEGTYPIKLHLIDRKSDDAEEVVSDENSSIDIDDTRTGYIEALEMARTIKKMIDEKALIYDSKSDSMRELQYKDIVILQRARSWYQETFEAFALYKIPIYGQLREGFFKTTEVSLMLNILSIVDNPYQDIPLAAILRSPIVGMNSDELARVRLALPSGSYYEALKTFLLNGDVKNPTYIKAYKFIQLLKSWTESSKFETVPNLVWKIYNDTDYLSFVSGLPNGKQKKANLLGFYSRAKEFSNASHHGIFRFLRFIERLNDSGRDLGELASIGEQENVVRMMTIHESKGLEFPVVFIGGLGKSRNEQDFKTGYLLDKDLGLASKYVDTESRLIRDTLIYNAFKHKMNLETVSEDMRVLYVALTRAKEQLYLFATSKDLEKDIQKWANHQLHNGTLLPSGVRANSKSFIDWIAPAVFRHKNFTEFLKARDCYIPPKDMTIYDYEANWEVVTPSLSDIFGSVMETDKTDLSQLLKSLQGEKGSSEYQAEVNARLNWKYMDESSTKVKAKLSVTEIKKLSADADAKSAQSFGQKVEKKVYPLKRPNFMIETKKLTPAERGTVMHMVMQHIDLSVEPTFESINEKLDELVRKEYMTEAERKVINTDQVANFYKTEIGQEILNATNVRREVPFSMKVTANEVYKDWDGKREGILVQGVIDCVYWNTEGEAVIVDYKTDWVGGDFEGMKKELATRYKKQMDMYSTAIERSTGKKVKHKYLYFFDAGKTLKV